jgi:alpha-galactosidase
MLLYQDGDEGNIHLWVPMSQKGDCWLSPEQDKQVHFHHTNDKEAHLLIVTTTIKQNFAQIIRSALAYYRKSILNEETIEYSSSDSILLDKLGYCTWNAFGKELTMEKLQMAIESLKIHDIPIGYLLLDDGWQRVSSTDQLVDFDACSDKFPDGLKRSISQLKLAYPAIQSIGVWHVCNNTS